VAPSKQSGGSPGSHRPSTQREAPSQSGPAQSASWSQTAPGKAWIAVVEVTVGVGVVEVDVTDGCGDVDVDVGEVVVEVVDGGSVEVVVLELLDVVGIDDVVVDVLDVVGTGEDVAVEVDVEVDVVDVDVEEVDVVFIDDVVVDVLDVVDVVGTSSTQLGQSGSASSPASHVSPRSGSTMPLPHPSTHARPQNLKSASSTSTLRSWAARGGSKRSLKAIGTSGKKVAITSPVAPSITNAAGFSCGSPPGALTAKSRPTVARTVPNAVAPAGGSYVLLGTVPVRSKR
jgi:hypothetical protein